MVPPWDLVPYANCGGTDFVHDIVHIAQTGPQGHFSVGPQRGRGLSLLILFWGSLINKKLKRTAFIQNRDVF